MAKFISENAASKATPARVIKYIMNPDKCCKDENGSLILTTVGLDDRHSYAEQFKETAELAGNPYTPNSRKYYHFKISCHPNDYHPGEMQRITPEQLKKEAEYLVHKKWPDHQAIITIQYHNNGEPETIIENELTIKNPAANEPHLHAHILLNASSFDPSRPKLRITNTDLSQLRDYCYELGKYYHLHNNNYWKDEVVAKIKKRRETRNNYHSSPINPEFEEKIPVTTSKSTQPARQKNTTYRNKDFIAAAVNSPYKVRMYDANGRKRSLLELMIILAAVSIKKDEPCPESISNARKSRPRTIYAKKDWNVQNMLNSLCVIRESGAESISDLELAVKNEGIEFGRAKSSYLQAKALYDNSVNIVIEELSNSVTISSIEERIQHIEKVKAAEYEKLRPIADMFNEAKARYKKYARALDTVKKAQSRQAENYTDIEL